MSTENNIRKQLFKTELETHKVELDLVGNLRSYPKGLSKYKGEGEGLIKKANRLKQELSEIQKALFKWAEVGDSIADDIIKDLKKFEKIAKELGFNAEIQIDYSNANDVFTEYAKLAQKYEKEAKNL